MTVHVVGIRTPGKERELSYHTALVDITERKKAEEAMAAARNAAEEATRAKAQFLANMSHEIRNPMAGVLGMLELVLIEDLPERVRQYLQTAQNSANSLLRLLNDILDSSRIEAGKLDIVDKPFYLDRCIHSVMEGFSPQVETKKLRATFTLHPRLPLMVVGDEMRLRQILVNLIGNAVKFTHEGEVEVTAQPNPDGEGILFAVRDTGIGIPTGKLDHIFEPFTQADVSDTRKYGGTGLGLTLCRQLVTLMGGRIWAESREGAGSVFRFLLPLQAKEERERTRHEEMPQAAVFADKRVIIADDDPTVALMFQMLLKRKGLNPSIASDGKEAVELWEKGDVDLILMDIQMPVMDGQEAVAAIRKKERRTGKHVPVIAVTARAMREEEDAIRDAGFDDYISKPVNFARFYEVLAENLSRRH